MEVLTLLYREDLDLSDATFTCPDPTTFCHLDELGLETVGQHVEPDRAAWPAGSWNRIGGAGDVGAKVSRGCLKPGWLMNPWAASRHTAGQGSPLTVVRVCSRVAPGHAKAVEPRSALRWALEDVVCRHATATRIAAAPPGLGTRRTWRWWLRANAADLDPD